MPYPAEVDNLWFYLNFGVKNIQFSVLSNVILKSIFFVSKLAVFGFRLFFWPSLPTSRGFTFQGSRIYFFGWFNLLFWPRPGLEVKQGLYLAERIFLSKTKRYPKLLILEAKQLGIEFINLVFWFLFTFLLSWALRFRKWILVCLLYCTLKEKNI